MTQKTGGRSRTAPHLIAGRSHAGLAVAALLIPAGALAGTLAFGNTLEPGLLKEPPRTAWLMAAGATSMALAAVGLGIAYAVNRHGGQRADRLIAIFSATLWFALGFTMLLVRWRDTAADAGPALAAAVGPLKAADPHVDVLGALNLAGQAIRAARAHRGTIYLEGPGLHQQGICVVLTGIDDTSRPRRQVVISQQDNLVLIWPAVAEAPAARSGPASATASDPCDSPGRSGSGRARRRRGPG